MNKKTKIIVIVGAIILVTTIVAFLYASSKNSNPDFNDDIHEIEQIEKSEDLSEPIQINLEKVTDDSPISAPIPKTSGKDSYYYKDYKISLKYPSSFTLDDSFRRDDLSRYNYSTISLSDKKNGTYLYLGDFIIYSTSGGLCFYSQCEEMGDINFNINGKNYSTQIIKRSGTNYQTNETDKDFVFQFKLPLESIYKNGEELYVTGQFQAEDDRKELERIIESISW